MRPAEEKQILATRKRRFLVHLYCTRDKQGETCRYAARIRPWGTGPRLPVRPSERSFTDDCELIRTINPLLPSGSDVRDVMEHIEGPGGFYYLLLLSAEQAAKLGWE
jgi:hypothetical protein